MDYLVRTISFLGHMKEVPSKERELGADTGRRGSKEAILGEILKFEVYVYAKLLGQVQRDYKLRENRLSLAKNLTARV